MNSDKTAVLDMIQQIRDRLDDVVESLENYEGSLEGYVERLDCIDDRLFIIESEFESYDPSEADESTIPPHSDIKQESEHQPSENQKSEAEKLADDTKVIYKEGMETLVEFADAVKDIKSVFNFKK